MNTKMIEIRDRGTFIPALAVQLEPTCEADRFLLARAGFGMTGTEQAKYVLLCRINGGPDKCTTDPFDWGQNPRTYYVAHEHIVRHWAEIESGSVVDVEFILGESSAPKRSESFWTRFGDSEIRADGDMERDRR